MFLATVLLYPCVLAVLCVGAGLLVDRCSGGVLPAPLLLTVGAAAQIALSQVITYLAPIAPATPVAMAVLGALGLLLGWSRMAALARRRRALAWMLALPVLAYALALAPVLLTGRPSFSSFLVLADSAVHMVGADYLIAHGQDYVHLDLHSSYGLLVNGYYNTSYPSGADTLFGGSALLLRLPLIWAFQPFNAFMLATAVGPAWLLARRVGLRGALAGVGALSVTLPALVYGYELVGSVKEITALPMLLTLGCLVALRARWLVGSPRGAIPFALVAAAGVSALGVGFGVWILASVLVLLALAVGELRAGRADPRRLLLLTAAGGLVTLIAAWPTWVNLSASLHVAQTIASTSNPGNLHTPLRKLQLFGIWLRGSYKPPPLHTDLTLTHALIALAGVATVLGAVHIVRSRTYALAGWLAAMLVAWVVIDQNVTTWVGAKTLVLTSPVVVLLAWGAVAALRGSSRRLLSRLAAPLLALILTGGVAVSDAMQYRGSNLAPTARYREMDWLNRHFAGRGPALLTDFDDYALYVLRDLDPSGPDLAATPAALAPAASGYGQPVHLDRVPPAALLRYPLIITRRDPAASRPPAAYRMLWQGAYYQVWERRAGAPAAILHVPLTGSVAAQCRRIEGLARLPGANGRAQLMAAPAPELLRIPLLAASHPSSWGHQRQGLVMRLPGRLSADFRLPAAGVWDVWVQGEIMPTVKLALDGHRLALIGGELSGNSLVPDTAPPHALRLSAGRHRLTVTRASVTLAAGQQGSAVLAAVFLTPAGADPQGQLRAAAPSRWRTLCGARMQWVELVGARAG
jgi:hypothetical protein